MLKIKTSARNGVTNAQEVVGFKSFPVGLICDFITMKLYCTLVGKLFFSQFRRCSTDAFETVDAQRSNRCEFTFVLHCLVSSRELFSPAQKYQLLVYHADAIFHDKEYRNAACKYSMALQQKKVLSKTSKVRTSTSGAAANIQAQVWGTGACRARVEGQLYTAAFWLSA